MNPDTLTAQSLLNCLVREVSLPEEQVRESGGHLIVRSRSVDICFKYGLKTKCKRSIFQGKVPKGAGANE